ncbi:MAG: hypothetical protein GXO78_10080 [Calditrichaeota bacterium]|nr:hypothetical protein [Calditrichota bacterium]
MARRKKDMMDEEWEEKDQEMNEPSEDEDYDADAKEPDDEEIEEDILELEEIEAKLESGEAFFTTSDDRSLLPKARIVYSCPRCRRIFFNNRWVKDNITDLFTVRTELAYCDRCTSKAVDNFVGSIEIYDKKLKERKDEFVRLAHEVEAELENRPPFEKIINIVEKNDILFIFTNTTRLAMEIGRRIRSEFHGGVQYEWFDRNQYLRVKWYDEVHNKEYFKERIRALKERRFGLFAFEDEE